MGWEEAGVAWGSRAADWAYLFEPYARPANEAVLGRCGVGPGTRLLDVGCGSGYALRMAADRGARVSGLDASESLVAIARARTPEADLRAGDMFDLPWEDAGFDVVTSFNSIWAGCDEAVAEAARVLVPGGWFGMTFWGPPKRMGHFAYFAVVAELSPPEHAAANVSLGDTGRPGVAEAMVEGAGLTVRERGSVTVVSEFPDLDVFVRAALAAGPSVPAIEHAGEERFAAGLRAAYADAVVPGIGLRIPSDFTFLTATKPTP